MRFASDRGRQPSRNRGALAGMAEWRCAAGFPAQGVRLTDQAVAELVTTGGGRKENWACGHGRMGGFPAAKVSAAT